MKGGVVVVWFVQRLPADLQQGDFNENKKEDDNATGIPAGQDSQS